jgi:hypothetical protein
MRGVQGGGVQGGGAQGGGVHDSAVGVGGVSELYRCDCYVIAM